MREVKPNTSMIITLTIAALIIMMYVNVTSAQPTYPIELYVDNYGTTYVTLNTYLTQGINRLELPVKALDNTISLSCNNEALPWILTDENELYTTSNESCNAIVSYIADIAVGNILTLNIISNTTAKIVFDEKVLILSIPETITSATREDGRMVIILKTPATLNYTVFEPTTQTPTTTEPTYTRTTETTTQVVTQTTAPTQALEPLTTTILIVLVVVILALIFIIKRK